MSGTTFNTRCGLKPGFRRLGVAWVDGVYEELWMFCLRLSGSGRAFHEVFANEVLIVGPGDGVVADDPIAAAIRSALHTALSPRHNPDDTVVVERLPHTFNGKRLEVPAKRLFMGVSLDEAIDASAVDDPAALRMLADAATAWRANTAHPASN
jgi:hypothetical protein